MKKNIFTAFVVLVAILGGWYLVVDKRAREQEGTPIATATFSCDQGKTIGATFYRGEVVAPSKEGEMPVPTGSVKLVLSDGRTMTLAQTISADGARYANTDESFVFWNKGNGALVLENNEAKSYIGCIVVAPQPVGSNLTQLYSNGANGFSIRFSDGYITDASYQYQMEPKTSIGGEKFTIPAAIADGTNLGHDTYLSVESLPAVKNCNAGLFLYDKVSVKEVTENGTIYSYAYSMGAGAGNRYEETIYALPGTNPCLAVRYWVHYSVIDNYPAGAVREFDKPALLAQLDAIRRTLVIK